MEEKFCVNFNTKAVELDYQGKIPAYSIFKYMQEAADLHTAALGVGIETLIERNLTWMLLKFHMQIDDYPKARENLRVETWASGIESRYADREFSVYRENSATPCAVASSRWLVIDLVKQRPIKVTNDIFPLELVHHKKTVPDAFTSLAQTNEQSEEKIFNVRLSDIDTNKHVSGLHYIEWIAESMPDDCWKDYDLHGINMEFRKQAFYGEKISSKFSTLLKSKDTLELSHVLENKDSDDVLAKARTLHRRQFQT